MKKAPLAANADAYIASLEGWQLQLVRRLRKSALASGKLEEVIKWGNLVYLSNGPVLVIRAEANRVLFGFWRGQRLRAIEERLKPGGKYEMATVELREDMTVSASTVRHLIKEAVALNATLGDPTKEGK